MTTPVFEERKTLSIFSLFEAVQGLLNVRRKRS